MNGIYRVGDVVLGKWTLAEELGAGSYGKVYRAVFRDFDETYESAIKIITVSVGRNEISEAMNEGQTREEVIGYYESFVGDMSGEFSIMSKLKGSSNIVGYEDHEVVPFTEGVGWDIIIRMELLTPLSAKLKNEGMTLGDIYKLGTDICRALELCRANSIIHRDIKTENTMVNSVGDYKLGDFGVARTMDRTTGGMSKKGTYTYMAPEVYKEEPYSHRADIYSLGLVLYRLLNNNRTPFLPPYPEDISPSDRETALARRFKGEPLPPPANATPELAAVILKACAYRPNDRFAEPKDLRLALEAAERGELMPVPEKPEEGGEQIIDGPDGRGEKGKKKRKPFIAVAAVLVLCAAAFVSLKTLLPSSGYDKALSLMESGDYEAAIAAFEKLGDYEDAAAQAEACEKALAYDAAVALMESGDYEAAVSSLEQLGGYRDSADLIPACEYSIAAALMENGEYEAAIAVFEKLGNYEDAPAQITACENALAYDAAVALMESGEYEAAVTAFKALEGYRDSSEQAALIIEQHPLAAPIGSTVVLGAYEQDNNADNGKEAMEWIVLDKTEDRLFVISKYVLDSVDYNVNPVGVTWETCTLRSWLNGTFLNEAFSPEEQSMIPSVRVPADKNPLCETSSGSATTDKIFLLSIDEALRYFGEDEERMCSPTAYARSFGANGEQIGDGIFCAWWLRTIGSQQSNAAEVHGDGHVDCWGISAYGGGNGIRPAMWITIE